MNRTHSISLTVAAAGGLLAFEALAEPAKSFEEIDRNNDGEISLAEARLVPELDFGRADLDRNGRLSRQEYMRAVERGTARV